MHNGTYRRIKRLTRRMANIYTHLVLQEPPYVGIGPHAPSIPSHRLLFHLPDRPITRLYAAMRRFMHQHLGRQDKPDVFSGWNSRPGKD